MVAKTALTQMARALRSRATVARHRRMIVLAGEPSWCREAAAEMLQALALEEALWVGDVPSSGTRAMVAAEAHRMLGRELDALVFDAFSGFDVEAFGRVSGALRGGGILLLLVPPLDEWPTYADPEKERIAVYPTSPAEVGGRFLVRVVSVLRQDPDVLTVQQGEPLPALPGSQPPSQASQGTLLQPRLDPLYRTRDQAAAVEAIVRVATGHRRRPAVLTSDRGRGKSAALGIAAARLLKGGLKEIVVTAPRLDAAGAVFENAARLLPEARHGKGALQLGERGLVFVAPDELALQPRPADLVLVDEAAAIPTPLLERLLQRYARIAFATTVHGYEGTGRGFAVRFQKTLDDRTPGWRAVQLDEPVRWGRGDPLERLIFRALALDASPAPPLAVAAAQAVQCVVERIDRDRLVAEEGELSELFGLLVLAHYQTTPLDLRHLLDGPNLSVWVAHFEGHVVGTALVAREGGFDPQLSRDVYEGRRRPRGHLMPQSLAVHAGFEEAPSLIGDRVMRLAVHPAAQGRGLGRRIVAAVVEKASSEAVDYVGSSFGATADLLHFWQGCGFGTVRLGVTREAASGTHSALVMRPLSPAAETLFLEARGRFIDYLPAQLADPLRDLEPELADALLRRDAPVPLELTERDRGDLVSFAAGHRDYAVCVGAIEKAVRTAVADPQMRALFSPRERALLIAKVLEKHSWPNVAAAYELSGRGAVMEALRQALLPLASHLSLTKIKH